jgi:2-keto-4-pentenoate hydratase
MFHSRFHSMRLACACAALAFLAGCASVSAPTAVQTPGCLSDIDVDRLLADINARSPAADMPETMTMPDARCTRAKLLQRLSGQAGRLAGYKVGLTNPEVQKRFYTDRPVWGALYDGMLLTSGATVDAAFGAHPLLEADLLVRVKDDAINRARTPAEVLANVDEIIPFIELPDLMVQTPTALNGVGISAINVGARLGVRGVPVSVPADADAQATLLEQLRDMKVRLVDEQGTQLGDGTGSDVLGHPLNAVTWLARTLQVEGLSLRPGQLVSLGSFSALLPPKPGQKITVHYDGIANFQPVSVSFR